jgi:diacylglycerol O-acyltransferase / wax synthase
MTRVTGMDVTFLYGETSNWHMHVCALTVLDPSTAPGRFDPEEMRALFAERLLGAPQFRWKLRDVARGLDHPVFVEDEHFDLARHFHRASVPLPGGRRELAEVAGTLMARKLDRSRPLWEIWLVDGLEDGHFALLTKVHHALIDGVSGADLAGVIMDLEPVPAPREHTPVAAPDPPPSALAGAAQGLGHLLLSPARTARYAMQLTRQAAVVGRHALAGTTAGLPFFTAKSALNGALTLRRHPAFASVPLADVRRVKEAFGVKVNDVVLAMVGDAVRTWLDGQGALPGRSLVAEMPLSVRTADTQHDVGTRVANAFVSLATDVDDPVDRLLAVHRSSKDAKALQRDLAAHKSIAFSDVPPPALLGAGLKALAQSGIESRLPPIYSLTLSSVHGPPFDFYMAGAKVVGLYPMGPLLFGSGLNVTALTLGDRIDFGVVACPDVVPDPWSISERLSGALADLVVRCPDRPSSRGGGS